MKTNNNGFTLIEVIIAVAIVGILTLAILSSFTVGYRIIANSGERSENVFEAQRQLEQDLISEGTSNASTLEIVFRDSGGVEVQRVLLNGEDINDGTLWLFIPEPD